MTTQPGVDRAGVSTDIIMTAERYRRDENPDEDNGTRSHERYAGSRKYALHGRVSTPDIFQNPFIRAGIMHRFIPSCQASEPPRW
jgi:hypothetical protein